MIRFLIAIATFITALPVAVKVLAFECEVCHSKNPKMVAMHTALHDQNCFDCHKVSEKLMGKNQPKDRDSLLKQRVTTEECLPCHGTNKAPLKTQRQI